MPSPLRLRGQIAAAFGLALVPVAASAQVPTTPPVNFSNSTSNPPGTVIPNLLDDYATLMQTNPAVMIQNYTDVATMTQARTAAQTLAAIHDDRTSQQYSVMNGLGSLTSLFLTGSGASASGVAPTSLTPTSYAPATLANYQVNINYLTNASWGTTTFGNGTATPLASAVNFVNNVVRANSSTEPPKRTFERYGAADPLNPIFANYSVTTNPTGLTTANTASLVVPSYLSAFTVPAPYANTTQWVQGFTVTQAMVTANGGQPITAPNLGTFDASGNFTPATFGVGAYVPGIGTGPRPYRVDSAVNVPTLLQQVINSTNPYADGAFPSGHTNSAYTQVFGLGFLVPQQYQELLTRASDLGNNRILAGMHSPLDVMGGRIEATAIAATNLYGALYDANGNRLDWTNPANASAYAVYQAYTQTQGYLAGACGTATVTACVQQAQQSGATASDPYGNAAQNAIDYTNRLTYGFQPVGPNVPMTDAQVPVQAQVLLLTRLPYLTDAQRTDVLATTALPSGIPLLSGNTWDGWGRLNYYTAANGYGAFNSNITVTMDASQGGYNAADTWSNDISGTGKLTKQGTGQLALSGNNSFSGGVEVDGGRLVATSATAFGTGSAIVAGGTLVDAVTGTLRMAGSYTQAATGALEFDISSDAGQTLSFGGPVMLNGTLVLDFLDGLAMGTSDLISILSDTALDGSFSNIDVLGINLAYTTQLIETANGLSIDITAVPEPGTLALLAGLALPLGWVRRRR